MGATTEWILRLVDEVTKPMKDIFGWSEKTADSVEDVGDAADKSKKKLDGLSAIDLFAINDAVQNIANEFRKVNEPGAAFNAQMMDLEAITGVTGDALEDLGKKGRQTAKDFGGDASAMLESYKGILSKLGPEMADNQEALDMMGRSVATTSKLMKGDAVGAMNALTGSVLQFGSDITDPMEVARLMTEQMNVMAASAKWGSAEIPFITESIKQAGTAAKNNNVHFSTANAVIQALGKGTIYGSEAGIGFRNMLGKMAGADVLPQKALEKIEALGINYDLVSDKTVPFIDRLKELQKAQADSTLIAQIFGVENQNAVNVILNNIPFIEELEGKIVDTNTATEQANVIMSGYNERMARWKTRLNDVAIGLFDVTSRITPMVTGMAGAVSIFANLANAHKGVLLLFNTLKTMPVIGKLVAWGSSLASGGLGMISTAAKATGVAIMNIPIIGWIAAIVAGLVALGVHFWKTSETFRSVLTGIWEFIKTMFTGYYKFIGEVMSNIWELIKAVFNPKNWFNKDFSIADAFSEAARDIKDAAYAYGEDMGKSWSEGRQKGIDSFRRDHPEDNPELAPGGSPQPVGAMPINPVSPVVTPEGLGRKTTTRTSKGLSGSGSGSGTIKNINQKIEVKNYFNVSGETSKSQIESIAEQVVRAINGKLSDSMVVAGT